MRGICNKEARRAKAHLQTHLFADKAEERNARKKGPPRQRQASFEVDLSGVPAP